MSEEKEELQCYFCTQPHTNTIIAYEDDDGEPLWALSLCATHLIWLGDTLHDKRERRMHGFNH